MLRRVITHGSAKLHLNRSVVLPSTRAFSRVAHTRSNSALKQANRISPVTTHLQKRSYVAATTAIESAKEVRPHLFRVGDVVHGWKVLQVSDVHVFQLVTYRLEHEQTGAQLLHIDAADDNNLFSISFRTPVFNDMGVPHVLEHTALCGSEKYPVKDPFFFMLKRSLNTFMNAWTDSDHTVYPFSTRNEKDYYNLMSVYLDATLFPRLDYTAFRQEAHRLEFEKIDDPTSPVQFKGIIFNEMKGAMGDPTQYFARALQQELYPNSPYAYNSGGEPENIVDLTYDTLKEYHSRLYHPSNARLITYGNLSLEKHIQFLNENGFNSFTRIEPPPTIAPIERFTEPKRVYITGPPDPVALDPNEQTKFAVSYLTHPCTDAYESFAMSIMSEMLFDEPRGPFYKSLIESGLAPHFAPVIGYYGGNSEASFTVGVQGINEESVPVIEEAIQRTFEEVAERGIEQSLIDAVLHRIELSMSEKSPMFGLGLASQIFPRWSNGQSPEELLQVTLHFDSLRSELNASAVDFFRSRIQKYFLNNSHKLTLVMTPDENHTAKKAELETAKLNSIESALSPEQRATIVKEALDLQKAQEVTQNSECLPTLTPNDIQRKIPEPIRFDTFTAAADASEAPVTKETEVMRLETPTNGLIYVRALTVLRRDLIPQSLLPYLPLFCYLITRMGARDMNYERLSEAISLYTGGIDASPVIIPDLYDTTRFDIGIVFSSSCLERNVVRMVDLLTALYTEYRFDDTKYLTTAVNQMLQMVMSSMHDSADSFATLSSAAPLSESHRVNEALNGLSSVRFLLNTVATQLGLSSQTDESEDSELVTDVESLVDNLQKIAHIALNRNHLRIMCTTDVHAKENTFKAIEDFISSAEVVPLPPQSNNSIKSMLTTQPNPSANEDLYSYIKLPVQVNYVSQSQLTVPFAHDDQPVLQLAGQLINSCYLHPHIREKGGAYGTNAYNDRSSTFHLTSYRDPNFASSLNVFENVANWIADNKFTDKDLDNAKLSMFQGVDRPLGARSKGYTDQFIYRIPESLRQRRREILLDTTREQLRDVVLKYFGDQSKQQKSVAVVGPQQAEISANDNNRKWTIVDSN